MNEQIIPKHYFLRVVNGEKIGSGPVPNIGDSVDHVYASPHPECISNIINHNDEQATLRNEIYDPNQRIVVISTAKVTITIQNPILPMLSLPIKMKW